MAWHRFCVGVRDVVAADGGVTVRLHSGRQQRIDVHARDEVIELRSVVARRAVAEQLTNPALVAWERNRANSLVGFRQDDRDHIVGECWVPTPGLTQDEFLLYVRSLAEACDLFEFQLTGQDRE